ncbi:hypothetical protein ACHAQA_000341 [Verticillium albo-atrum]
MDLPLEVRLQIYQWASLMHPLRYAQLAPWYPTPSYAAYPHELIRSTADKEKDVEPETRNGGRRLLSSHRLICSLPSALLRSSKQTYNEARLIPFHENEFVFVNWFSSGLWAARAFTRPLQTWQSDAMRYVRLEVLGRDFSGAGLKEWMTLCDLWAEGLRGLRLKILIGTGPVDPCVAFSELNGSAESQAMDIFCDPEPRPAWIEEGLRRLRGLRSLEVELASLDWDNDQKLAWCASLKRMLNAEREASGLGHVTVACVRKLSAPKERAEARNVVKEAVALREFSFFVVLDWLAHMGVYLSLLNLLFPSGIAVAQQFIKSSYFPVVRTFALAFGFFFAFTVRMLLFLAVDAPAAVGERLGPRMQRANETHSELHAPEFWELALSKRETTEDVPMVLAKKYKAYCLAQQLHLGPAQREAMVNHKRTSSC